MAVQREYSARLQLTASGRKLLAFKPRFGLAKYLVAAAMDSRIAPLEVVRLLQFRTGGHHLQCMVDRWRADGHTTPCRCGTVNRHRGRAPPLLRVRQLHICNLAL